MQEEAGGLLVKNKRPRRVNRPLLGATEQINGSISLTARTNAACACRTRISDAWSRGEEEDKLQSNISPSAVFLTS